MYLNISARSWVPRERLPSRKQIGCYVREKPKMVLSSERNLQTPSQGLNIGMNPCGKHSIIYKTCSNQTFHSDFISMPKWQAKHWFSLLGYTLQSQSRKKIQHNNYMMYCLFSSQHTSWIYHNQDSAAKLLNLNSQKFSPSSKDIKWRQVRKPILPRHWQDTMGVSEESGNQEVQTKWSLNKQSRREGKLPVCIGVCVLKLCVTPWSWG